MSWTQGLAPRCDLPEALVKFLDSKVEDAMVECVVWDETEPNCFRAMYYRDIELVETLTFRLKKK